MRGSPGSPLQFGQIVRLVVRGKPSVDDDAMWISIAAIANDIIE